MAARGESMLAIESVVDAARRSGGAVAGRDGIERVLESTESRVAGIFALAQSHAWEIEQAAEARTAALITESRRQVAQTRVALVEQVAKVAYNYESLLGLLDEMDRALGGGTH